MNIANRLEGLRSEMKKVGLQAYIVPSSDPHQSEYVADYWKAREWISGFTGSAGTVVVTPDHAGVWTDARYFIQAEKELSISEFELHKTYNQFTPDFLEWINTELPKGSEIGVDGWMISQAQFELYDRILKSKGLILNTKHDLIASAWNDRPPLPGESVFEHETDFTGINRQERIEQVRNKMQEQEADYYLASALDDIGWLLNLRGRDVECNPVFIAYLLMSRDEVSLYVDQRKLSEKLVDTLGNQGISLRDYKLIIRDLNQLSETKNILVDTSQINVALYQAINATRVHGKSICKWEKAIKNEVEIDHIKHAMAKDGAALAETFHWLDNELQHRGVTEVEVAEQLIKNRSEKAHYYGESFHAIVGYRGNGAIIHYRPKIEECATIRNKGILLVDSGGQYHDGTTDITRTFTMGEPTTEQKKHYTLVLKGMIALTRAKFPKGTPGGQLDTLARQFLWQNKINFLHGTGHGVGYFMNVHEPPQGFASINSERGKTPLQAGMITSNEPGYYKENEYGIRIENLVVSQDIGDGFLGFETLTLYPMEHALIEVSLLSDSEKEWINTYHQKVFDQVVPLLNGDKIKSWFKNKCCLI